jgi:6-phospho-beta-glucosidase
MEARRIAVLGGGAYAARLVELAGAAASTGTTGREREALELRLYGRDRGRLAVIAAHAAGRLRAPHRAIACAELPAALDGAEVVILLIRVGGLAARAHDESFPARFGLVGDEGVGVGGMANAWRTLPVLDGVIDRLAAHAPDAHVLNLMAPLGGTTRLLAERGRRAVGLCELPAVTRARWSAAAGPAVPAAAPLAYAGLNHLGCFWPEDGPALEHPIVRAAIACGDVTAELVARLGAAPLHYLIDVFEPEVARRLGRARRPDRARELAALSAALVQRFAAAPGADAPELDRRPTPWFEHALVPALHAALGGPPFRGPLDLPNAGALDEAPAGAVVELWGRLDAGGARLDPAPARPPGVRALLARLASAEDALYRAALGRDRALLGDALDALPVRVPRGARADLLDDICAQLPEVRA